MILFLHTDTSAFSPLFVDRFLLIRLHFNIPLKTRKFFVKSIIKIIMRGNMGYLDLTEIFHSS